MLILSCGCASEPTIDEQAYYEQGIEKLQALNYPAAMEAFLHAQKISEKTGNDSILILTKQAMMALSDSICDTRSKMFYALEICRIYERKNMYEYIYSIFDNLMGEIEPKFPIEYMDDLLHYASIIEDRDSILIIDGDSIMYGKHLAQYIKNECESHHIEINLAKELKNFDLNAYISLIETDGNWRMVITEDSTIISPQNAHFIASKLWDSDNEKKAKDFISFYRKNYKDKEIEYSLTPIRHSITGHIKSYNPDWDRTLLMRTFQDDINSIVTKFRNEEELNLERALQSQRLTIIALLSVSIIIILFLIFRFKITNMRRMRFEEDNIRSAAELKNTLSALEDTHIKTLTHLCNTYYDSYNNESTKSKIAKDALNTIIEIAENEDFFSRMETRLNESDDNLMFKFRSEITTLKDAEYKLYICNAIGLSIPAICLLLKEKRDVIYARRLRLRTKIQESDAIDKETFLNHLK